MEHNVVWGGRRAQGLWTAAQRVRNRSKPFLKRLLVSNGSLIFLFVLGSSLAFASFPLL